MNRVTPAFRRRALASDLMTWHYETPARLALHLEHDRGFFPWIAARGLNAFCYIRHTVDSRARIDELAPLHREHQIASEYGGHVMHWLLPRDRFATNPEFFPVADGARNPKGNLCVSDAGALAMVRERALLYLRENPDCALLHLWGADVWDGAWCRCANCAALSPQLQYLTVVNAVADALAAAGTAPDVTYLAYHDTLEPDPALDPRPNVAFEWAPRERCYSHAIDDPGCATNPRYWDSLKRYIDLFDGRGHVFEYYADAILFGGLSVATPSIIVRDLRAYRGLGLDSISCLTFGQHSLIAYPVNLATFARATQSPDFAPDQMLADTAAERHPRCAREMAAAYQAIARASTCLLDRGGDLMRPKPNLSTNSARLRELKLAHAQISEAIAAAGQIVAPMRDSLVAAERELWEFQRELVSGIADYLAAAAVNGSDRAKLGDAAINRIAAALAHLRAAGATHDDTWTAYDLEWVSEVWLDALRRRLADPAARGDESA